MENQQNCEGQGGVWTDLTNTMGHCGCAADYRHGEPNVNPAAMSEVCLGGQLINVWFPPGPGSMAQCAAGDTTNATVFPASTACAALGQHEHGCGSCGVTHECDARCGLYYLTSCAGAEDFGRPGRTYYTGARAVCLSGRRYSSGPTARPRTAPARAPRVRLAANPPRHGVLCAVQTMRALPCRPVQRRR